MADLTTQMRDYLDAISPPITPEEIVTRPVTAPVARRRLGRGPLIAVAAFVAVLVVFGVAILFWNGGGEATPEPAGPVETVTLEELDAAIRPAVDALVEAPGFTVAQQAFFESELGESVWATSRRDGDFVALAARDLSVQDFGSESSGVAVTGRAYVDGVLYHAAVTPEEDTPWSEAGEALTPDDDPHLPIGVQFPEGLYPPTQEDVEANEQVEATRQELSNGGVRFTVTRSSDTSEFVMTWDIHPNGHLAEYSLETNQASSPEFPAPSQAHLRFSLLTDPSPISAPAVGTPLDPTQYDIPQDLDLLR